MTLVTAITTPSNNTTPSYIFTTNKAGTITTNIDEGFSTPATASTGSHQTITFNTLPSDTYSGKTITVTDAAGNDGSITIPDFIIDTTAPTMTLVTAITTPSNNTTPSYIFTTNKAGTITTNIDEGFSSSDAVTTGSDQTITFDTLPEATYTNKTITVTDAAGNVGSITIPNFVIDTTIPTMTITSTTAGIISGSKSSDDVINLTFTSSKPTTDFFYSDITVVNGEKSNFTAVSSTVYTAIFIPIANSTCTIDVAANAFKDAAGNNNTAAQFTWTQDRTKPTMTITSTNVNNNSQTSNSSIELMFTSSDETSNFIVGDITVGNGSLSSFSATSSTDYTAIFTPTVNGACTIDVLANTFTDTAGNNNTAATQFNWLFDSVAPAVLSITMSDTALKMGDTATVTLVFSEAVANFSKSNITAQNGTLSSMVQIQSIRKATALGGPVRYLPTSNVTIGVVVDSKTFKWSTETTGVSKPFQINLERNSLVNVDNSFDPLPGSVEFWNGDRSLPTHGGHMDAGNWIDGNIYDFHIDANASGLPVYTYGTPVTSIVEAGIQWTITSPVSWGQTVLRGTIDTTSIPGKTRFVVKLAPNGLPEYRPFTWDLIQHNPQEQFTQAFTELVAYVFDGTINDLTAESVLVPELLTTEVTWTGTYTPNTNTTAAANVLTLDTSWTDVAGNVGPSATTANFTIDTTLPIFSSVSPSASSYVNTANIGYTLSENISSGTITFTRSSGALDSNSPHTANLAGEDLNAGERVIAALIPPPTLVSGTIYTIAFNGTDVAGNNASQVEVVGVTFDTTVTHFPDTNFYNAIIHEIDSGAESSATNSLYNVSINTITSLDVNGETISDLTGIEGFTALEILKCYNNSLTSLDVTQNTALTILQCYNNDLHSLDVTQNTALILLNCNDNSIASLDVTQNTALLRLDCYNNSLTTLDVTKNTALTMLLAHGNSLTTLDVTQNTALTHLYCNENSLTTLDVTQNTALTDLWCYKNNFSGGGTSVITTAFTNTFNGTFDADPQNVGVTVTGNFCKVADEAVKTHFDDSYNASIPTNANYYF